MMFLAAHADLILAAASMGFNIFLLPTVWTQWRTRASTVSLITAFTSVIMLATIVAVFIALHLWVVAASDVINAVLWAIVGAQRVHYGTSGGKS